MYTTYKEAVIKAYAMFILPVDPTDHFGQLMTFFKVLGAFAQRQISSWDVCFINFSFFN